MTALAISAGDGVFWRGSPPVSRRPRTITEATYPGSPTQLDLAALSGEQMPDWLHVVAERLEVLSALEDNWDGHGARSIPTETIAFALELILRCFRTDTPVPQIVPLAYGGLQIEWHQGQIDLELEVAAPNEVHMSYGDLQTGQDADSYYRSDFSGLAANIRLLSQ